MCEAFANGSTANTKFSKTQLGGYLGKLLGPLIKTDLPLKGTVL